MTCQSDFSEYLEDAIQSVSTNIPRAFEDRGIFMHELCQSISLPDNNLVLFKYQPFNERNVQDLLHGVVHVASAYRMNDVNEGWQFFDKSKVIGAFDPEIDDKKIKAVASFAKRLFPEDETNRMPTEDFLRSFISSGDAERLVIEQADHMVSAQPMLRKKQMCASFSESCTSASMWDRYANGHKGFVAEYRSDSCTVSCVKSRRDAFTQNDAFFAALFPVLYGKRADISTLFPALSGVGQDFGKNTGLEFIYLLACLAYKAKEWEHEQEWRIATYKPERSLETVYACLAPRAIYLGLNMNADERARLLEVAQVLGIKTYDMEIDFESIDYSLKVCAAES